MAKELKSVEFANTHKLAEFAQLNEANSFDIPADLYADVVLKQCDITPEQLKKKERLDGEFLSAMVYVGGEAAAERMKENKELSEIGMTFPMGSAVTADVVFGRAARTVVQVNHKTATAEMKRVLSHVDGLFDSISS